MIPSDPVSATDRPVAVDQLQDAWPGQHVPYAPDFTPATLGKTLGEDQVLPFLLKAASEQPDKSAYAQAIGATCLAHIEKAKDRRDMASHVLQGLRNYGLIDERDPIALTPVGADLLQRSGDDLDEAFARHILTRCNGYRLIDEIQSYVLRGDSVSLEDLSRVLDRHATSKSISTMRAWLGRAGVFRGARGYDKIDSLRVEAILGKGALDAVGLSRHQVEFLLAARIAQVQSDEEILVASDVANLAVSRVPGLRLRRKALGRFVQDLGDLGFLYPAEKAHGAGGTKTSFVLKPNALTLADEQLRGLLAQAQLGFPLSELKPLAVVEQQLATGPAESLGRYGEMMGVHLCLMLGLRVVRWRKRAPHSEIDLIAERRAYLSYERWAIQVKNVADKEHGSVDIDRVDREVGAVSGLGITHILFIAPRSTLTRAARLQLLAQARRTPLHLFALTKDDIQSPPNVETMLASLRRQAADLFAVKAREAERLEE